MITGVGVDIVEVDRIAAKISKENGFRELVFSETEIAYCESRANKFEHYAARFAAKEAFLKAIGTGWAAYTAFNEIEVVNDDNGKPSLNFLGITRLTVDPDGFTIQVSLTHIKSTAVAFVILEKQSFFN